MTEAFGQHGYMDSTTKLWTPYGDEPSNEGLVPRRTTVAGLRAIEDRITVEVVRKLDGLTTAGAWRKVPELDRIARGDLIKVVFGENVFVGRLIRTAANGIFTTTTMHVPFIGLISFGGDAPEENPSEMYVQRSGLSALVWAGEAS
jgi:hypothetical protein